MEFDYRKYRWFYTSSGKLVVGGKNAEQNEELIKKMKAVKNDRIAMHTQMPGSPFSIILAPVNKISNNDIKETAIFTASFSRAWREKKEKTNVDIFKLSQLYKSDSMKEGTFGVKGEIKRIPASLELAITKQKSKLRAVPSSSIKSKDIILKIIPGETDKLQMLPELQKLLPQYSKEEILAALPSGGIKILKK